MLTLAPSGMGQVACVEIERRLPPVGLAVPDAQSANWAKQIESMRSKLSEIDEHLRADIEVLLKACEYAILHREFYRDKDFAKLDRILQLASERMLEAQKANGSPPSWLASSGRQVRGFRSAVDDSCQPIGLLFPQQTEVDASSDTSSGIPLYVWLHGRGDKSTDLHFLCERLDKDGQITPANAIVLHPFGRQCVGYKSAGETDVMEAIDFVCENYPIDQRRIVLMGFSMGGAGVWHLAAHYSERFVAASPGAGFADTSRYQRLKPEDYPPKYEQELWKIYDVPNYTRNLFNLPVVAYSGEEDKQIQAARVMEEAFESEGRTLTHLIGPGMGHKYHPDTLAEILDRMAGAVREGKPTMEKQFSIQATHRRYAKRGWVTVDGIEQQYTDTRLDGSLEDDGSWSLRSKNASRLVLKPIPCLDAGEGQGGVKQLRIDGQEFEVDLSTENLLTRHGGRWESVQRFPTLRKHPGLSGPIDDAFLEPFLVVVPTGRSSNAKVDQWVECELAYFQSRWRSLFRGELRSKRDVDVTPEDSAKYHLILWGTPASNLQMRKSMKKVGEDGSGLPFEWNDSTLEIGGKKFGSDSHVPVVIYPNPAAPDRYLVWNSGPTFRTAHDRTNSLQNPHLPDWAVISLEEPRSAELPGKIVNAGFFDEFWQTDPQMTW